MKYEPLLNTVGSIGIDIEYVCFTPSWREANPDRIAEFAQTQIGDAVLGKL